MEQEVGDCQDWSWKDPLNRWVSIVTAIAVVLSIAVFLCGDLPLGPGSLIGEISFFLLVAGPPTSLLLAAISFLLKRYALCVATLLAVLLFIFTLILVGDATLRGLKGVS